MRRKISRSMRGIGGTGLSALVSARRTGLACMTSLRTFMNGARIGIDAQYYNLSPKRNPQGPSAGTRKASRGGSWRHQIQDHAGRRPQQYPPEFQYSDYGFRCALSI